MSDEFLSLPDFSGYYSCSKDMSNKTPIDFFEFQFTDDIVEEDDSSSSDIMWVACSKCGLWVHICCIEQEGEKVEDIDFICIFF